MRIYCTKDYKEMSRKAANLISAQVIIKPDCVLGLATGSTPIGIYDQLVEWYHKNDIDFSEVTTVNLDEYRGLTKENDQSYYYFMHTHLFDRVNIRPDHSFIPDGTCEDSEFECRRYENQIRSLGGIDMQLLGLGRNGHIGFNEPSDSFASEADVPRQAYTMGIGTILQAKKILLVASGEDKAEAVKNTLFGPITPYVPASILQIHPDVTIVADEAALSLCKL